MLLALCFQLGGRGALAEDALDRRISLDIPANSRLEDALIEWGTQAGMTVLINTPMVEKQKTEGVRGTLRAADALSLLLRDSGLSYTAEGDTIRVVPDTTLVRSARRMEQPEQPAARSGSQTQVNPSSANDVQKNKVETRAESTQTEARRKELEEVIVTAQKRAERLIDTPQSVSVLSSDNLAKLGAVEFRDFANTVPGLNFRTAGAGHTQISLRGVTAGRDIGPTVGIYVDEVPYGASTNFASASLFTLDVGLFDLDRIEVLRGPQGALYGASAMGGVIRYVTKRPDLTRFGVDAQTGISGTDHGGVSYNVAAVVNAPIVTGKVALRASGFESHDGGHIDNLALGQKDIDRSDIYGGRADLLFTPTEALGIRITGFLQDVSRHGQASADYAFSGVPLAGSLDQRRLFAEPFDQRFRLVSGTVTYDLDWASLTSISSYQTARTDLVYDYSRTFVSFCAFVRRSCSAVGLLNDITTDKFVQEVRLASEGTKALEWVIGGFYTHETSDVLAPFMLRDLAGQPAPNDLGGILVPSLYEEYAPFGTLTWHMISKFDVTGGVRYARNRQTFKQIGFGFFGLSKPTTRSTQDVFTYLGNARYHFSDHATAYLRYATGYKPGGPNFVVKDPTTGLPIGPETFEADRLKSYEVGFKAETADRRFGIDVAGYYIDWSNMQISVSRGKFAGVGNAPGGASVRGAELALTARPARAFTVTGAFAYQDARMSEADPNLRAAKGERLPNVPHFTAALNADYDLPVGRLRPRVGATLRYVDDRMASFDKARGFLQYRLPNYTTVDLRAGFMLSAVDAQLYVHNLFDERGQFSADTSRGVAMPAILQPRTIGVTASTKFR